MPSLFFRRYGKIISTKAIIDQTTNKCKGKATHLPASACKVTALTDSWTCLLMISVALKPASVQRSPCVPVASLFSGQIVAYSWSIREAFKSKNSRPSVPVLGSFCHIRSLLGRDQLCWKVICCGIDGDKRFQTWAVCIEYLPLCLFGRLWLCGLWTAASGRNCCARPPTTGRTGTNGQGKLLSVDMFWGLLYIGVFLIWARIWCLGSCYGLGKVKTLRVNGGWPQCIHIDAGPNPKS